MSDTENRDKAADGGLRTTGLFAVGDDVIADRPIAGYGMDWQPITYCGKGDVLTICRTRPNGWYEVAKKNDQFRVTFLMRHRELSPANV